MPITQIDPIPALVVIDLQKGIVGLPTVHSASEVVQRSAQLARAFRQRGFPVVLVNVAGGAPGRTDPAPPRPTPAPDWAELVPELEQSPTDHLITKKRWGAFIGTSLHENLESLGVTQIFLVGIATSIGVESTARSAFDHGYNVVLVTDAMTDRSAEAHENSVTRMFPRMGETETTANVLRHLEA